MRAVVTGASRGIGLEFVRQLAARGATVVAGARDPSKARELAALADASGGAVHVHPCDVASDTSVAAFARAVGDEPIDLLVNNAGVYGERGASLEHFSAAEVLAVYDTNAVGPLRVTAALLGPLRKKRGAKIVHVTSGLGSISDNTSGGMYAYRMSKAALNMASRSLALDLKGDGIISVVINPGWVQTDMGGAGASISAETSVKGMLSQIDAVTLDRSGAFLNWNGKDLPF